MSRISSGDYDPLLQYPLENEPALVSWRAVWPDAAHNFFLFLLLYFLLLYFILLKTVL